MSILLYEYGRTKTRDLQQQQKRNCFEKVLSLLSGNCVGVSRQHWVDVLLVREARKDLPQLFVLFFVTEKENKKKLTLDF